MTPASAGIFTDYLDLLKVIRWLGSGEQIDASARTRVSGYVDCAKNARNTYSSESEIADRAEEDAEMLTKSAKMRRDLIGVMSVSSSVTAAFSWLASMSGNQVVFDRDWEEKMASQHDNDAIEKSKMARAARARAEAALEKMRACLSNAVQLMESITSATDKKDSKSNSSEDSGGSSTGDTGKAAP